MATIYKTQKGDSLSKIAGANNTTVEALAKANNIQNPNLIQTGVDLNIPDPSEGVSADSLKTSSPMELPTNDPMNAATSLNGLLASITPQITTATEDVKGAEKGVNTAATDLQTLTNMLGQQTEFTQKAEQDAGIPEINKELLELQNQARQKTIEYNTTPYSLAGQGRAIPTNILRGQEVVKQRQIAIDAMVINSNVQAKQGQLALAQSTVDRAVAAQFEPIKARIEAQKMILDQNYKTLSRADQKLADTKKSELDIRLQEIAQEEADRKSVLNLVNTAAANGAPNALISKAVQASTPEEAMTIIGGWASDPLDRAYKVAQINKINNDMATSGVSGIDPASVLAYAQQYASTGTIPTGLPKGTFGMVAQVAKELPKSDGTLIDKTTGIKSTSIKGATPEGVAALYDLTKKMGDLSSMYPKNGLVNAQVYNSLRSEIVDLLARARTGAALTASEEAYYKGKLPNIRWSIKPLGKIKLEGLKDSIEGKLNTTLDLNNSAIVGYSKVDTGGGTYTVGEIIDINGLKGRVNPDGTITEIAQ